VIRFSDENVTLHHGDSLEVLAGLPEASVDAVVTDPPYELGFMGKGWDASGIAYSVPLWAEVLRVLKPGGHLLSFGGTRTWHRMVCAIEDAGFEIRDELAWLYGSGFPKSLDVSKAIDRRRDERDEIRKVTAWIAAARNAAGIVNREIDNAFGFNGMAGHWTTQGAQCAVPTLEQVPRLLAVLGVDPEDVPDEIRRLLLDLNGKKGQPGEAWFRREVVDTEVRMNEPSGIVGVGQGERSLVERLITAPATPEAERWNGWGTALKPAHEPICLARKPLVGTVAENVLTHGTGALNVDGCRVGTTVETWPTSRGPNTGTSMAGGVMARTETGEAPAGRWPANVVLDEEAAAMLDQQSGTLVSGKMLPTHTTAGVDGRGTYGADAAGGFTTMETYDDSGGASRFFYVAKAAKHERPRVDGKAHATVKPVELMRWLVRLVTPPGGLVLDPFAGSGTTAEACIVEGFRCVLIEKDADHLPLIEARLSKPIAPTLFGGVS
jgi:DNA modification methylase